MTKSHLEFGKAKLSTIWTNRNMFSDSTTIQLLLKLTSSHPINSVKLFERTTSYIWINASFFVTILLVVVWKNWDLKKIKNCLKLVYSSSLAPSNWIAKSLYYGFPWKVGFALACIGMFVKHSPSPRRIARLLYIFNTINKILIKMEEYSNFGSTSSLEWTWKRSWIVVAIQCKMQKNKSMFNAYLF